MTARALALLPTPGDLRAALPRALLVSAALTLIALRLLGVTLALDGLGDPSYRAALLPLDAAFAGLMAGMWWERPDDAGLLLLSLAVETVEMTLFEMGGL